MNKKNIIWIIFGIVLLLALSLRLYKFSQPIADWHSWRQSDTAAVSKIFAQQGFDVLHPKYYDISNVQSGFDNPEGYRFVEFPLFNIIHAGLSSIGIFTFDEWGRLTTIFFSLLALTFIFLIVRKYFSSTAAVVASFFYAVLPFSVFYGRAILPDTAMIASVLGGIYFFSLWTEENLKLKTRKSKPQFKFKNLIYFSSALLFSAAALLFKPYALFFLLPIGVLALEKFGFSAFKKWQLWMFAVLSVIPLAVWRLWITQFPEGVPASNWLFNEGNIRFKGAYFYWIFGERISQLILGYYVTFAVLGVFKRAFEKHFFFFISFLISSLLYLVIIARGNVQHDYYQIAIIPSLAILIGRGVDFLFSIEGKTNKIVATILVVFSTFLMLVLSWYHVREFYAINNPTVVEAGKRADEILPQDAKVIANMEGDTTLLYYVNRQGWPAFQDSTEALIELGATHMVWLHPSDEVITEFEDAYKIIVSEPGYVIVEF